MARKKGVVIGWEEDPKPEDAAPGVDTQEVPSASFPSTSSTSTCPHCNSALQRLPIAVFRDHVASCTADDLRSSGSSLSTPPASPSQLLPSSITDDFETEAADIEDNILEDKVVQPELEGVNQPLVDGQEINDESAEKNPRPYNNPLTDFDYYDQYEPQEGSDADQNPPEPIDKFPFPKVTDVDAFEEYLQDAQDMTYEELYRRTAVVSDNLVVYQAEWDAIDKEIFEHETYLRSEEKRIEEETRAAVEEDRLKEDEERDRVETIFKDQLKLNGKKWQEFLSVLESEHPKDTNTIRHLQNLRNPQFMAAARKKKRTAENKQKKLLNAPWPEVKKTKEDLEIERRKRGRYMDPVKFDDMKQADIYGFEYSAHIKHYGQQPMAAMARQVHINANPTSNPFGDDTNDTNRTRTQRKQTRKVYEADASVTPEESDADGKLPVKRARKPKIFIDGVETLERSRGQTRSGTPAVRTFASGKRVGRPPTKSKLQAVQLAQPSVTPELSSEFNELNQDNDTDSRGLAASQEAQLHDAAESLVNQTHNDQVTAAIPINKPKHPGGRPRKIRAESSASVPQAVIPALDSTQPKPRNRGGRPRKNPKPVAAEYLAFEVEESHALKTKPKKKGRRVKKETVPDEDLQLGEGYGVLQSTEQDEGSQYTSENTTRPTTSDSNATASTFGSRRSARPATRDKTNAREARTTTHNRRDSVQGLLISASTSGRGRRKRNTSDTDQSPIVVQPGFGSVAEPSAKKRRNRTKQGSDDVNEYLNEVNPDAASGRTKRKRGDTISETIAVAMPFAPNDAAPAPKKRRRRAKIEEKEQPGLEPEVEEEDSDAGIDETLLDPVAREALRKKRIKKEKSRKLSRNMKARWANGGMKEAQETRKTNNALKRAWKQQSLANEAAGLPPPPPPVLIGTVGTAASSTPASAPALPAQAELGEEEDDNSSVDTPGTATPTSTPALKSSKKRSRTKLDLPKRPASKRTKRPTRMALDGDEDEELEQQFASEYDRYQALTSPRKPVVLGKRVRRSLVDLSQLMDDSDDDDDEEF